MTALSRRKGAAFERLVAAALRPVYPDAERGLVQTRDGAECSDVENTPWWIEAKHRNNISLDASIAQAVKASDGRPVVAITRRTRGEVLVTMRLDDWLELAAAKRDLEMVCARASCATEAECAAGERLAGVCEEVLP